MGTLTFGSHNFLSMILVSQSTKEEICKINFIGIKGFWSLKGHHQKIKNGTPEWKITFVKQILDKGLLSTIYKELL